MNICDKHNGKVVYETVGCPVCMALREVEEQKQEVTEQKQMYRDFEDAVLDVDTHNENEIYDLKQKIEELEKQINSTQERK